MQLIAVIEWFCRNLKKLIIKNNGYEKNNFWNV